MTKKSSDSTKLDWEKPTLEIVAMTSDVHANMAMDVDEDFDGLPS